MAKILGVDYGRKRVGLAHGDLEDTIAFPLSVLRVNGLNDAVRQTVAVCRERDIERIVVGWPLNMNGSEGPMAEEAGRFADKLRAAGFTVVRWDERLTSYSAEQTLIEADVSRRKRRDVLDKMAAQQILQSYLDAPAEAP